MASVAHAHNAAATDGFAGRLMAAIERMQENRARRAIYRQTVRELNVLTNRDLADLGTLPSWPDVLNPPGAFITPATYADYIVAGPNFGEHTVAVDLVLFVDHGDAAERLTELESMVQYALINTADWALTGVDAPAPIQVNYDGAEYLTCVIHLSKSIRIRA